MTNIETRRYEMLVRVHEFCRTHESRFAPSGPATQGFAAVADAVRQLGEQAVSQRLTARDGYSRRARAREALLARLDAIARAARVLAEERPGFDEPFHVPREPADQVLLTVARVFGHEAAAHRGLFAELGLAATFIEELNGAVDGFAEAIRHRAAGRSGQAAARARIAATLAAGSAAVRRLEVIVANQLRDDPALLAAWERSRRVEYPRPKRGPRTPPVRPEPDSPPTPTDGPTLVTPVAP